jgi:NAD-dependent dihydropyrimidine dehydrogenase PreA subunit
MIAHDIRARSLQSLKKAARLLIMLLPFSLFLAPPVCAAICPKGRSGCPYPGRCFLYTDADANSLCDYTLSGAAPPAPKTQVVVPTTLPPSPAPSSGQVVASVPGLHQPVPVLTDTPVPFAVPGGQLPAWHPVIDPGLLLAGILLFISVFVVGLAVQRYGIPGRNTDRARRPVLLPAMFAVLVSVLLLWLLMPESAPVLWFVLVFILGATVLSASLWREGLMTRGYRYLVLSLSILAGFVFGAPLMPLMFPDMNGWVSIATALAPGILIISVIIIVTFLLGRLFCGQVCPVGAVQESASRLTRRKIAVGPPVLPEAVRFGVLVLALVSGGSYAYLISFTGISSFFELTLSVGFFAFLVVIALSVVVYRPLCRFLCPFGAVFSVPAHVSRLGLDRTELCINCRRCEKVCPVGAAGREASKRECYLCGRCTETCPVAGALVYRKRS